MSGTPPVVLLHGWAMNGAAWGEFAGCLGERVVLTPDLPGHGREAATDAGSDAAALASALANRLPSRFDLVGWSFGGQLALRIAALEPARVRRLVLIATPPCLVRRGDWTHGMEEGTFAAFSAAMAADLENALHQFRLWQVHGCTAARRLLRTLAADLATRPDSNPATLRRCLAWLGHDDLRALAATVRTPARIVMGASDPLVPTAAGVELTQLLATSSPIVLDRCGHAPFLAHPREVAGLVCQHLDSAEVA